MVAALFDLNTRWNGGPHRPPRLPASPPRCAVRKTSESLKWDHVTRANPGRPGSGGQEQHGSCHLCFLCGFHLPHPPQPSETLSPDASSPMEPPRSRGLKALPPTPASGTSTSCASRPPTPPSSRPAVPPPAGAGATPTPVARFGASTPLTHWRGPVCVSVWGGRFSTRALRSTSSCSALSAFAVPPWQPLLIGRPWGGHISCLAPNQHAALIRRRRRHQPVRARRRAGAGECQREVCALRRAHARRFLLKCSSSLRRGLMRCDITALCFIFKR